MPSKNTPSFELPDDDSDEALLRYLQSAPVNEDFEVTEINPEVTLRYLRSKAKATRVNGIYERALKYDRFLIGDFEATKANMVTIRALAKTELGSAFDLEEFENHWDYVRKAHSFAKTRVNTEIERVRSILRRRATRHPSSSSSAQSSASSSTHDCDSASALSTPKSHLGHEVFAFPTLSPEPQVDPEPIEPYEVTFANAAPNLADPRTAMYHERARSRHTPYPVKRKEDLPQESKDWHLSFSYTAPTLDSCLTASASLPRHVLAESVISFRFSEEPEEAEEETDFFHGNSKFLNTSHESVEPLADSVLEPHDALMEELDWDQMERDLARLPLFDFN